MLKIRIFERILIGYFIGKFGKQEIGDKNYKKEKILQSWPSFGQSRPDSDLHLNAFNFGIRSESGKALSCWLIENKQKIALY